MNQHRRSRWLSFTCRWLAILVLAFAPASTALAARDEQEPDIVDARLEGYANSVSLPAGSSGLTYFLFVILLVFMVAGLFKDAKRSHLD